MKEEKRLWNQKWIGFAVIAVVACLCVKYSDQVIDIFILLLHTAKPLLFGCVVAYILNILMKKLEKIYFPKSRNPAVIKSRRPVCVFSSILLVLGIVAFMLLLVVPTLGNSVQVLTKDIPKAFDRFQIWLVKEFDGMPQVRDYVDSLKIDWSTIYQRVYGFLSNGIGSLFTSAFSVANVVVSFAFTGVIAIIFSIYLLFQKERIGRQFQKLIDVYVPEKIWTVVHRFLKLAHVTFTGYISGQVLEAFILGSLCGLGMAILRLPYALMTGVVVGAAALIPIMGAYIGASLGVFMIITVSPLKAVEFLVFLVILQQFEGNVIYPRVVGGSIGLPGIWVLAAVTIGGGLFGIPGMLIGVPLSATLYKWLRSNVNEKIQLKNTENELTESSVDDKI